MGEGPGMLSWGGHCEEEECGDRSSYSLGGPCKGGIKFWEARESSKRDRQCLRVRSGLHHPGVGMVGSTSEFRGLWRPANQCMQSVPSSFRV